MEWLGSITCSCRYEQLLWSGAKHQQFLVLHQRILSFMHMHCCAGSGSHNLELDSAAQNFAEMLAQALVAEENHDPDILTLE